MPSHLFQPIRLRDVTLPNRIAVAPMCQYQATAGVIGDYHLVHLGQMAQSGAGLIIVEATGVVPEGRITPHCPGLWNDAQEAAFARTLRVMRDLGPGHIGIQLVHAGRKASTAAPWDGGGPVTGADGWPVVAPSALPYLPTWPVPTAMDADAIAALVTAFGNAAERADRAGFDLIEIHAAHGYLLHQFLSPLTNHRTDAWGGDATRRMRLVLDVFAEVRRRFPAGKPVTVRVSASDWIDGGLTPGDLSAVSAALRDAGCDLIHVSSGGLDQGQQIPVGPGYQVSLADQIRRDTGMPVMAVGLITEPTQAETILATGQADMIALARAMLWNPRWPWHAAAALGSDVAIPRTYARSAPSARGSAFLVRK